MSQNQPAVDQIFLGALEQDTPEKLAAFLDAACGKNLEVRQRVERLLAAQRKASRFLEEPAAAVIETAILPISERTGDTIGPYKLLQQIGEGGMGVVYMAEQSSPVERRVALKIIKPGMDTQQVIARFEAERQALAMMDHPNIAKVLDAGQTDSGRPYFVMELVKGIPVTQYCDEQHLSPRERLELFVPICHAVQHAHQKGIIHRDLKPSNILIAQYDDKPVPKVIDFGVAKAISHNLTEKTMFTQYGQIVGTIEYMSPEQARFNQLDVDTRSDIYSLGVLLYELLTGETPFDKKRLRAAAFDELLRIIREEEPPRMSVRLSSSELLANTALNRRTEPKKLNLLVRGELDWIVMKALEKDRGRRYETAIGFAADIERYLNDDPVTACPPSSYYRFWKFARRNKSMIVMVSVIGIALLLAAGSFGWIVRDRDNRRARTASEVYQFLERAESLYANYKVPEALAEVEKARGLLDAGDPDDELRSQVRQWLTDIETVTKFETLRREHSDVADWDQIDREYSQVFQAYGIDTEVLSTEDAATQIAQSRIMFELTVALDTWAWRLQSISRTREPEHWQRLRKIQRAADPDPLRQRLHRAADTGDLQALRQLADEVNLEQVHIRTLALLANTLTWCGDPETAVTILRAAQHRHPESYLINEALGRCLTHLRPPPWEEVIEFRRVALALSPRSLSAHAALSEALCKKGRTEEAVAVDREALRLQPKNAKANQHLGWALFQQQQFADSETAFRAAIELQPELLSSQVGLGKSLLRQERYVEALVPLQTAVQLDPTNLNAHESLGWALVNTDGFQKAELSFREVIRIEPTSVSGHYGLGKCLFEQGEFSDAEVALTEALAIEPTHFHAKKLMETIRAVRQKVVETMSAEEPGSNEQPLPRPK